MIPVIFGITVISFAVMKLAPGKAVDAAMQFNPKASLEARAHMEKLLGLDQPVTVQYVNWLRRLIRFDFDRSFRDGRLVTEILWERFPVTLAINVLTLGFTFLFAIPLGVLAAVKPKGLFDRATTFLVFVGYSIPGFWLALLGITFFGVHLRVLPVSGLHALDYEVLPWIGRLGDLLWHLILPVGVMTFISLAGLSRYVRSSMVNVLRQDYIRTAYAKGLKPWRIWFCHGLRNALLPIVTIVGLSLPDLIAGSVVMETVFSLPGMGRLFYDAVMARDQNVVMALVTIGAFLTLIGNLLADLAYAWADPRIRVGESQR